MRHGFGAAGLWAIVGLCAGCVSHAGPEAMALLERGRAALDANDHAGATDLAEQFLSQNARTAEADEAYYLRGMGRWRAGDPNGARADLQTAASKARTGATHYRALKALGDLAMRTGEPAGAVTVYRQAIEEADANFPGFDEVRYSLGRAHQQLGQWWQADGQFDRLIYTQPDSPAAARASRRIRCNAWTFRIAAHSEKAPADEEAARLTQMGLTTRVRPAIVDDRLIFFVEAGRYQTRTEAEADAGKVRGFSARARIVPTK